MNFQKPENGLRRAEELIANEQPDHALQVLHQMINNKKFRGHGWDVVQEQIMLLYVALCVDLGKLRIAREGLHQYRSITHVANAQSLGKVLRELRDRAEAKLTAAKEKIENIKLADLTEDLEAEEPPEVLLLQMVSVDGRNEQNQEVHTALRMCWETYKIILDILRMTAKQEKLYHETAQRGLEFCSANERPQEFKRLCEVIRNHYAFLLKNRAKSDVEPLLRQEIHLETRLEQLKYAAKLELWRESYQTAEDIYNLGVHDQLQVHKAAVSTVKAKVYSSIAMYYEKLGEIFWVSDLLLFHAQARMRHMLHTRQYKQVQTDDLASGAVLAVMSIPLPDGKKHGSMQQLEHDRKLSMLLNHTTVPTRESLKSVLGYRDILTSAGAAVQTLYRIVEVNPTDPLIMCAKCQPLLDSLIEDPQTTRYIQPIKRVIIHKMLRTLSKTYSSMSISYFTSHICPQDFLTWNEAEIIVVGLVQTEALEIRLDYINNAFHFDKSTSSSTAIVGGQLSQFGQYVSRAVSKADAARRTGTLESQRVEFYKDIEVKLQREAERLQCRNEIVKRRREEQLEERRKLQKRRMLEEQEKIEQEQRLEEQRRVEEQKKREEMRRLDELQKDKLEAAMHIYEELKKLSATASKLAAKVKSDGEQKQIHIRGLLLASITVERIASGWLTLDDFDKCVASIKNWERQDRAASRRLQAKKVDHLMRAMLDEEAKLVPAWDSARKKEDQTYLDTWVQTLDRSEDRDKFLEHAAFKEASVQQRTPNKG